MISHSKKMAAAKLSLKYITLRHLFLLEDTFQFVNELCLCCPLKLSSLDICMYLLGLCSSNYGCLPDLFDYRSKLPKCGVGLGPLGIKGNTSGGKSRI